jgi:hypothetical protein
VILRGWFRYRIISSNERARGRKEKRYKKLRPLWSKRFWPISASSFGTLFKSGKVTLNPKLMQFYQCLALIDTGGKEFTVFFYFNSTAATAHQLFCHFYLNVCGQFCQLLATFPFATTFRMRLVKNPGCLETISSQNGTTLGIN